MDISISDLFGGKSTRIKNSEFLPTKNYVEPFINKMTPITGDFRIKVKLPDQMTFSKDATDLTYNRVLIEAVLPSKFNVDNHQEVIGFLYGLDVKKPIVKFYRGYLNQACTNLSVFEPKWIEVQELTPGDPIDYSPIKTLLESPNNFANVLENLKSTYVLREDRISMLGSWVDKSLRVSEDYGFGKVKIPTTLPIKAYESLYLDGESEYFIPLGINPTMFDIYNAFTQLITDDNKDIMNKFEKTMIIKKLLEI